eukprot:TRINITY_DN4235_c1_g1_i4.p1 TRINITY_DN4235_c1_g1~~TRINITY_DN4235_c1_g1_i4.p1  ORF type:complete len:322 (+),score=123.04 TRINITY_DN4235_c1_g1_i4:57-968(+)
MLSSGLLLCRAKGLKFEFQAQPRQISVFVSGNKHNLATSNFAPTLLPRSFASGSHLTKAVQEYAREAKKQEQDERLKKEQEVKERKERTENWFKFRRSQAPFQKHFLKEETLPSLLKKMQDAYECNNLPRRSFFLHLFRLAEDDGQFMQAWAFFLRLHSSQFWVFDAVEQKQILRLAVKTNAARRILPALLDPSVCRFFLSRSSIRMLLVHFCQQQDFENARLVLKKLEKEKELGEVGGELKHEVAFLVISLLWNSKVEEANQVLSRFPSVSSLPRVARALSAVGKKEGEKEGEKEEQKEASS